MKKFNGLTIHDIIELRKQAYEKVLTRRAEERRALFAQVVSALIADPLTSISVPSREVEVIDSLREFGFKIEELLTANCVSVSVPTE